jgi:RNA polymerase-interacting CarD/CdnL/TRCF family regulator
MRFKAGDQVVHVAYGVGQVVRLSEKQFSGQEARLYYEVTTQKGTVWVPVDTQAATPSLRRLTALSELARYRSLLTSRPTALDPDRKKRHLHLVERLKQGSFQALCESVRDVTALGWKKPLSEGDSAWLRKAREDLCQEWAKAAGITASEASREIEALLEEARQNHRS